MFSKKLLVFLGLLVLVIGGLARLPASLIADQIHAPGLKLDDVRGTIWKGEVNNLVINSEPVAPIRWELTPASLLTGKLRGDIIISPRSGDIRGTAEASLDGSLVVENLLIQGSLREIASGTSLGPVAGSIDATFERILIRDQLIQSVAASGTLRNIQYPAGNGLQLGDFAFYCLPGTEPPVVCNLKDSRSPLELDAKIELNGFAYKIDGRVRARRNAPQELSQSLMFLGRADNVGFHELQFQGALQ